MGQITITTEGSFPHHKQNGESARYAGNAEDIGSERKQ